MEIYAVILSGMGDFQGAVVDKDTFEWITSPRPDFPEGEPSMYETLPFNVKEARTDGHDETYVTTGSYENDRALAIASTVQGYEPSYGSFKEMFYRITARGDALINTYEGAIY